MLSCAPIFQECSLLECSSRCWLMNVQHSYPCRNHCSHTQRVPASPTMLPSCMPQILVPGLLLRRHTAPRRYCHYPDTYMQVLCRHPLAPASIKYIHLHSLPIKTNYQQYFNSGWLLKLTTLGRGMRLSFIHKCTRFAENTCYPFCSLSAYLRKRHQRIFKIKICIPTNMSDNEKMSL